jgi:hypothetical protein
MNLSDTIKAIDLTDYPHSFAVKGMCKAGDIRRKTDD